MTKNKEKIDWREIWKFEYTTKWKDAIASNIENGTFDYHITKSKYVVEHLVIELICNEIPFKVANLGAGFKKVYALDNICDNCKGKGVK